MRSQNLLLLVIVLAPVLGSLLLPLTGAVSARLRNALAILLVLAAVVGSALLVPDAMAGRTQTFRADFGLGINFALKADALAVFMALASSLISAIILIYSTGYIAHYANQNEYYLMVVLFLGAMMGLVYSANLILLYVFWEITAICSWRLIGFFREPMQVLRADKAFLVTVFGALAMLLGFVMLGSQQGSFDMPSAPISVALPAAILILLGILSKSATLPFHTWLPDAGVAPSPVTALLHAAVLVKIGVYVYARLFVVSYIPPEGFATLVMAVAATSALVSAGAALLEHDMKRIIAYSTISQIGFIFLGLAAGNELGLAGALIYILAHGFAKGGLFLCAGIIEHGTHTKDIRQMGGLLKTMPVTAIVFLFCAFSVMGVPPLGGFFGKYMVISAAINSGHLVLGLVFLLGAFLTVLYLLRLFNMVFLGESRGLAGPEGTPVMVGSVVVLAALALASGLAIYWPALLANQAASQMLGIAR